MSGAVLVAALLTACTGHPPAPQSSSLPSETSVPAVTAATTSAKPPRPAGPSGPRCAELLATTTTEELSGLPVATAVSRLPALSVFSRAVTTVPGLADALDHAPAVTVLVPQDSAWEALPEVWSPSPPGPPDELGAVLQHHVVRGRHSLDGILEVTELTMIDGGSVTVSEDSDLPTFTDAGDDTAHTLCGDIPTANGTVVVIDRVLRTDR